jgi:uncharacterized protein YjbI with pentapeptide repeats
MLRRVNLEHAKLCRAVLGGWEAMQFQITDMSEAKLCGADLSYANFSGIILENADLLGADITQTNLAGTKLHGTIMPDGTVQP